MRHSGFRATALCRAAAFFIVLKPAAFFSRPQRRRRRKYEKDADRYVLGSVGSTRFLREALKRLAKENLANLHPHPTYVAFYYSHLPLARRVERLQAIDLQAP